MHWDSAAELPFKAPINPNLDAKGREKSIRILAVHVEVCTKKTVRSGAIEIKSSGQNAAQQVQGSK